MKTTLDVPQRYALGLMTILTLVTFILTNAHVLLWRSSDWLVGAVLPAVVHDLTNNERAHIQTAPLQRSAVLDQAATNKAQHMAEMGYFSHFAPDGTSPWSFFIEAGYEYDYAGENLAVHFTDSTELHRAWMNSPLHRENIMSPYFTEIGIGTARGMLDGYETVFVVQLFGAPSMQHESTEEGSDLLDQISATARGLEERAAALPAAVSAARSGSGLLVHDNVQESQSAEVSMPDVRQSQDVPDPVYRATTSALATAAQPFITQDTRTAGQTIGVLATKPQYVSTVLYMVLASTVFLLLVISVLREWRQHQYIQVIYSLCLLSGMAGLWWTHVYLTSGAVVL